MAKKKAARSARTAAKRAQKAVRRAAKASARAKAARKPPKAKAKKAAATRAARSTRVKPARRSKPARSVKATARRRSRAAVPKAVSRQAAATKPRAAARPAAAAPPAKRPPQAAKATARKANLDRPRRTVADIHGVPSSLDLDRQASAARSGRAEMEEKLHQHTSTSPALTAGDVDADWAAAESVGDEAPGGDNPTPDQDVVDEIGRALGVEYDDDEELKGGEEIAERDRHRWELDPGSSDDFEER